MPLPPMGVLRWFAPASRRAFIDSDILVLGTHEGPFNWCLNALSGLFLILTEANENGWFTREVYKVLMP